MAITYVGTYIIVCVYFYVYIHVCILIISLYGGSHASDVLHVLVGVSVAYVTNHVL